jgi:chaperonin cofactor prefoldin
MVCELLQPCNDRAQRYELKFQKINEDFFQVNRQLETINKAFFHRGEGLSVFENINQELSTLNTKNEDLQKKFEQNKIEIQERIEKNH